MEAADERIRQLDALIRDVKDTLTFDVGQGHCVKQSIYLCGADFDEVSDLCQRLDDGLYNVDIGWGELVADRTDDGYEMSYVEVTIECLRKR